MLKRRFTKCQRGTIVPPGDALALHIGTWHGITMAENPRNPTGGGIFIALGAAAGVIGGQIYGQTSIGLVAGVGVGSAIALFLWWRERG